MTPWDALAAEMSKMNIRMVQDPTGSEGTLEQQALWVIAALLRRGFKVVPVTTRMNR